MSKHKHLTNSERQQIEHWLNERVSIKKIATYLGKSTSTITREIVKRAVVSNKRHYTESQTDANIKVIAQNVICVKTTLTALNSVNYVSFVTSCVLTSRKISVRNFFSTLCL